MLVESAEREVSYVPLSNNIISRWIKNMSLNIQKHIFNILFGNQTFSLQIDKSIDISQKC